MTVQVLEDDGPISLSVLAAPHSSRVINMQVL